MSDDLHSNEFVATPPRPVGRLKTVLGQLAALLTLASALPTLGACGAAYAWPLELLSHFRVQYAAALLVLACVLLLAGRYRWAAAATMLLALNAWHVAPYLLPLGAPPEHAGARLRLVSINVFSGNRTPDQALTFLQAADADVIVVLEFTPEWERRLAALKATHPHSALHSSNGNFGIALYSRLPLDDFEWVPLSDSNPAIAARVLTEGKPITIIGAHPVPPRGPYWSDLRNRQLNQLAKYAASLSGPVIVAGDLNITPFSPVFDDFLARAKLHDPRRGQGLLTTWPANRLPLRIPIDHVLVGEGATAQLATGPDVGSDHLPVKADISVTSDIESR